MDDLRSDDIDETGMALDHLRRRLDDPAWTTADGRSVIVVRDSLRGVVEAFAAIRSTDVPSDSELDHIAWAQHVRAEHEATHGEAEQCGAECIVLGLTDFDEMLGRV